ncbi:MAG: prepilin-type N-terminal cleavage/methylation domain-containing protein [Roseimicrobium sp.]
MPFFSGRPRQPRASSPTLRACGRGFTLMELLLVLVILAAVAALVVSHVDRISDDAEMTVARAAMQTIAEAFTGSAAGPGYVADMKYMPGFGGKKVREPDGSMRDVRLHDLLYQGKPDTPGWQPDFDPISQRGWRGPYLRNVVGPRNTNQAIAGRFPAPDDVRFLGDKSFLERGFFYVAKNVNFESGDVVGGEVLGDIAIGDPCGNPIILQVPPEEAFDDPTEAKRWRYARLVSAGPDGVLMTPRYDAAILEPEPRMLDSRLAGMLADGTTTARGDDLVLFLNRADTYEPEEP